MDEIELSWQGLLFLRLTDYSTYMNILYKYTPISDDLNELVPKNVQQNINYLFSRNYNFLPRLYVRILKLRFKYGKTIRMCANLLNLPIFLCKYIERDALRRLSTKKLLGVIYFGSEWLQIYRGSKDITKFVTSTMIDYKINIKIDENLPLNLFKISKKTLCILRNANYKSLNDLDGVSFSYLLKNRFFKLQNLQELLLAIGGICNFQKV